MPGCLCNEFTTVTYFVALVHMSWLVAVGPQALCILTTVGRFVNKYFTFADGT